MMKPSLYLLAPCRTCSYTLFCKRTSSNQHKGMLSFYCHAVVKLKQAIIISLNHAELLRNAENYL